MRANIRTVGMFMRGVKILGLLAGGFVLLLAVLLLGISLFVNPNDYKTRIEQEVKTATGRDLQLHGDIKLSVFPWVALELGPASLGNPEGFAQEPFVSFQRAKLRVKLLPLLQKELQIGRIEIDALDVHLIKNAQGKGNWEDFGQKKTAEATPHETGGHSASLASLGGILIANSRIRYDTLTLGNLSLDVGNVAQRTAVPVKASFDLDTGPSGTSATVSAEFDVTLDTLAKRYGLAAFELSGDLKLKSDSRTVPWKFIAASFEVDMGAQTFNAPTFSAQFAAAQLSGSLKGQKIIDAPSLSGALKLEPLVLREFLARIGTDPPNTRDVKVLSKFSIASHFVYQAQSLHLQQLEAQLDDSQLRGSAAMTAFDTKAMSFDLALDHIDLDRYLPAARSAAKTDATKPDDKPFDLPTNAVKALDVDGNFKIDRAKIAGVTLTAVQLTVHAKAGVVRLFPVKAALYGGLYAGDIDYDVRGSAPAIKLDQQLTAVDMAPLLKDSVNSERVSGRGNASTRLAGQGRTSDSLLKNLSGRVEANLANGAVEGIDIGFQINRALALLKQRSAPIGADSRRTKFDSFKMSADVADGVATTKDLAIASQYLRLTGTGSSNIVSKAIDYHIVATLLKSAPTASAADSSTPTLVGIPVEVSGTMNDPKVRPDIEGILKSNVTQKLQNTLKDKLQGIFR